MTTMTAVTDGGIALDLIDSGSAPQEGETDEESYERERQENMKQNQALLASLGLNAGPAVRQRHAVSSSKKVLISAAEERTRRETRAKTALLRRGVEPSRRSGRVAALKDRDDQRATYRDTSASPEPKYRASPQVKYDPLPKQSARAIPTGPEYDLSAGPSSPAAHPSRAADGTLVFEGRWGGVFTPNVTPEEMFGGGAFAGGFFVDAHSSVLNGPLNAEDDLLELPFSLPSNKVRTLLTNDAPDGYLNRFRARAGQSLAEWEKAGWIWAGDPRGWAQWYTRFWSGRRCDDDERQVRRWQKVAGPTGRFKRALLKKVYQSGGEEVLADEDVGRVLRQCLWQWGYELNRAEYGKAMAGDG